MRRFAVPAILVLLGCASTTTADPPSREWLQRPEEGVTIRNASTVRADTVAAAPDATMRALVETYQALEIPVTRVLQAERRLESRNVRVRRIGGERMSRFVDCGTGITGQRADQFRVSITLMTSVVSADGGMSRVVTDFDATARPRNTSGSEVYCTSRGTLEVRLLDEVRRWVAAGSGP